MHPLFSSTFAGDGARRARFLAAAVALIAGSASSRGLGPNPQFPPSIGTQPASTTEVEGETVRLSVTVFGNPTPTYQWRKNGVAIRGATSDTFFIFNAQFSDAGNYDVIATNKFAATPSQTATLTIVAPVAPSITTQPASVVVEAGQPASFSISAAGLPAPTYQWRKDGVDLPGATRSSLNLPSTQTSDAGAYDIVVTNRTGSVTSSAAVLTLGIPLTVAVLQPSSALINWGALITFDFAALGKNVRYQWKKNGVIITGATNHSYTVSSATSADMGFYTAVATGDGGSVESDVAVLTIDSMDFWSFSTLAGRAEAKGDVEGVGNTARLSGPNGLALDASGNIYVADRDNHSLLNANPGTLIAASTIVGAFLFPSGSKDAALFTTLSTAVNLSYSVPITSSNAAASGITLAEIYDAEPVDAPVRLAAVSTLGFVGPGTSALVPGFVIGGREPKRLLIRAVGPGLTPLGVGGALADPRLAVIPAGRTVTVARNDNWSGDAILAEAFARVGAFALAPDSKDAALIVRLPPGGYTVTVSGAGETTGTALVEIYDLDP